jgi:cullin 1
MHHQRELLEKENTGVRALLKSHADDDLTRLYALYSNIPSSLPFIAHMLQQHIVDIGSALQDKVQADQAAKNTYIEDLMKIHETYFELVRKCFAGNATFQKALKEAFENIINRGRANEQSTAAGQLQDAWGGVCDQSPSGMRSSSHSCLVLFVRIARDVCG